MQWLETLEWRFIFRPTAAIRSTPADSYVLSRPASPAVDGCAGADRAHRRPRHALRALRLPPHHRRTAPRRLARQSQAGGTTLAPRGATGAGETPPAGPSLAGARCADAATGGAPPPCLVLRRRLRPDRRRAAPPVAGHRGRGHAGVPPPRRRPAAAQRRRPGPPRPALRRAGPTDLPPLRQRPSVHRHRGPRLADAGRRDHARH